MSVQDPANAVRWEMEIVNEEVGTTEPEVICGVNNGCIIFQDNIQCSEIVTVNCHPEFLDIQVAEEEVIGESWGNGQSSEGDNILHVQVEQRNSLVYEQDEVEIPLPQDQDSYTTQRPYPCDFCSRRFRKKANLTNHMIAHQSDRPHGCNLCGARYHRKSDLVTHMKIHAYAPGQDLSEDDDDDEQYAYMQENNAKVKGRRKKPTNPRKRKGAASTLSSTSNNANIDDTLDHVQHARKKMSAASSYRAKNNNNAAGGGGNNSSSRSYVDEDMRLMMQQSSAGYAAAAAAAARESLPERRPPPQRWPVTDPSRPYVCQHCGVGFAREKALASHSRIHAGDSPFECTSCGEMFWDLAVLKEHSRMKHGISVKYEDEVPYTGDDRFGEFHCETCGLSFHRQDLLKRHRRVHIKAEMVEMSNMFVCQVCSHTFADQADLLAHVETHARYQPHRCMLCGECFMNGMAVAAHVRRRHAKNIPPNACTQCGKTCKDRRSLQKHSWVHSVERSFSCFKCGKRFHSRARLKRHMVSHRDKAVACEDCGEEFPDGRALINHRHSHTKDLSSRQFHCVECGKTFGSRSSQQIHARIHTGERPYGCRFCWKAFADGGTLRKHERIHTGEKPYACPVCPRAFNQRVVLREHIRSHHSGADPKMSNHLPVYVCKVCTLAYDSSEDLCAHLISHSDENTAKHRAPRLGPRKYKRRRKLNSAELNLLAGTSEEYHSDERSLDSVSGGDEFSDREMPKLSPTPSPVKNKAKSKKKSNTDRNLDTVVKTFESVVENFNFFVDSAQSETKKSKKKKSLQKQKKSSNEKNISVAEIIDKKPAVPNVGGFVRSTRPSGQPRVRPRTKNVSLTTLAALKSVSAVLETVENNVEKSKAGPRTKNVNYHNVKMSKLPSATFPTESKPAVAKVSKAKAKRKAKPKSRKGVKKAVSSPKKATTNTRSPRKAAVVVSPNKQAPSNEKPDNVSAVIYETSVSQELPVPVNEIKQEFVCEMCSETFTKRSELLLHVPVHI